MANLPTGLSRFASELPPVDEFVSLGECDTPLLRLEVLAEQLHLGRLSAKLESQNPTGSYKDRVAAMSMSLARQRGNAGWIATSSGNAGLAMAAYGARAALPGFLCLDAAAPLEKQLPLMPYSIGVVGIPATGIDATESSDAELFEYVSAAAKEHNLYLGITAHAFNHDGMRGIDTIGYELADDAPDASHVYVPTGGGGLLVAIARGLAHRAMPTSVVACQPAGCAPIAQFLRGQLPSPEVQGCTTMISALQLPQPPDGELAVDAVRSSGGWGTAVSDKEILDAQGLLAAAEGVFVEPASATGLAALIQDVAEGRFDGDEHVVLILTGAGWKDLGRFAERAAGVPRVELQEIPDRVGEWASTLPADGRKAADVP